MSNFNLQTSHPLIKSEQTFVLDRKLISIHSVDRDYQKWPKSNNFGVDLGEAFHNVQSMRLINFAVPSNNYTFSTAYQNTKMSFSYKNIYPFDLSGMLHTYPGSMNSGNSWDFFKKITVAIFGIAYNPTNSPPWTQPPYIVTEWYNSSTSSWVGFSTSFPINPTTEWVGKFRFIWSPPPFTITIPEGSYSPNNLTTTIESLMNKAIYNGSALLHYIPGPIVGIATGTDISGITVEAGTPLSLWNPNREMTGITPIVVHYNAVTNKILFGCEWGEFTLLFSKQEIYNPSCDVNKAIFNQYTKWGLPSYLGFSKKDYTCKIVDISDGNPYQQTVVGGLYLPFESTAWLTSKNRSISFINTSPPQWPVTSTTHSVEVIQGYINPSSAATEKKVCYVEADFNLDINGEDALYMEIDRYNSIDEIYPYSERTGHLYNNDLGHRTNGSFAKIPLTHLPFGQEMGSRNNFVLNVFHSDPPIQRIDRLKFIFRYHDGRLVDFKNLPFSFTLEFNMLKDEQERGKKIRVPALYNL
jgi:hypothetical protein